MSRFGWLLTFAMALALPVRHGSAQNARPNPSPSGLQRLLDAELARFPARAGVWVKHLTTGEEAAVHADDAFNSASVIKLPVMALAFELADKGTLSLSERITIKESDFRG